MMQKLSMWLARVVVLWLSSAIVILQGSVFAVFLFIVLLPVIAFATLLFIGLT